MIFCRATWSYIAREKCGHSRIGTRVRLRRRTSLHLRVRQLPSPTIGGYFHGRCFITSFADEITKRADRGGKHVFSLPTCCTKAIPRRGNTYTWLFYSLHKNRIYKGISQFSLMRCLFRISRILCFNEYDLLLCIPLDVFTR